jgi:hypothetical protein
LWCIIRSIAAPGANTIASLAIPTVVLLLLVELFLLLCCCFSAAATAALA